MSTFIKLQYKMSYWSCPRNVSTKQTGSISLDLSWSNHVPDLCLDASACKRKGLVKICICLHDETR